MSIQNYDNETEQKIIIAARQVFLERGFDGAKMQDISEQAGVNKALLHYYFRSKENLFEKIYIESAKMLFPKISEILENRDLDFFSKIRLFVEKYVEMICENPLLPIFILREINSNSEKVQSIINELIQNIKGKFMEEVQREIANKTLKPCDPRHIIMSILSLCVFPFPAMPLFKKQFGMTQEEYLQFLKNRIPELQEFIISGIKA